MAAIAMAMGGHIRVGFEDNIYLRYGELATSNAKLVEKVVNVARELDRPIASPDDAREMLGLKSPR
jgi:3-keto-5-aminohexanoate cleavage enzyme